MTQAIPETSPPSQAVTATLQVDAGVLGQVMAGYTDTKDMKSTVDAILAESGKKTSKVKAATAAPKGLLAGKPKHKSRNKGQKGQVPWNKGLKLAPGGKRPTPARRLPNKHPGSAYNTQAAAENAWLDSNFSFDQFTQPPAEVRQFKSKFKKGTNYDKGYEAGYQEAIHDMTMILVVQVGRKQL